MKAVFCPKYGPPETLQLIETDIPKPKEDQLLIKVKATSVTVADARVRAFRVPKAVWLPARLALGISKPKRPILGVELSGIVESVGNKVQKFKPGDQIFASALRKFGGYAEYAVLSEKGIAKKPDNITFEEAATLPIGACTALHFLRKCKVTKGTEILIYGASGSVGTYAVQIAKHYGAKITAVCSSANFELVKSLGANTTLDYKDPQFENKLSQYDVVFIAVDALPFRIAKKAMKDKGYYTNMTLTFKSWNMLWTMWTSGKKIFSGNKGPETSADLNEIASMVQAGALKPVIDRIYPIEEIVEAHRYVDKGHKIGNVGIRVS